MSTYSFPKELHILKRYQFRYIQRKGAKGKSQSMRIFSVPNKYEKMGRVGLTVSKKVGNAVVRNQVKRFLREIVRHHKETFAGQDIILIANPPAATKNLEELQADFLKAISNLMPKTSNI